mgnify:CR=1 FL=1
MAETDVGIDREDLARRFTAITDDVRARDLSGLDPAHQGGVIRVPLPSMNEERRKELAKQIHKFAEEGHIAIRHQRTHARDVLKRYMKNLKR